MPDVRTRGGRNLRVHEAGDRDGVPVIVHHGTPSTGQFFRPHVEDACSQGIRLIGYDRPGYGGSTLQRDRAIAETADDVTAIADALGLEQFATWGISGGGPHALACGAQLPDRVTAVATLAAHAPIDAAGLDWTAGLGEANLESFEAMRRGRDAHEEYLRNDAEHLRAADANELKEHLQSLLTPVDRTALTVELTEYFTRCWRDALRAGIDGWCEDERQGDRPWGFPLDDIGVPALLWHGRHDLFVPFAHGEWLAEHIPGVDARLSDEDGHLTLFVHRIPEVHAWLLAHA